MDGDRAAREAKVRLRKWPCGVVGAPAKIKRAIGHRITGWKKRGRIFVNNWNADFVQLRWNFRQPLIASDVASRGFVRAVDESPAPQTAFFGGD